MLAPRHALRAFLLTILFVLFIPLLLMGVIGVQAHALTTFGATGLALLLASLITIRSAGVSVSEAIPQKRLSGKAAAGCAVLGVGLFLVSASAIGRLYEFFDGGYTEFYGKMMESVEELVGPLGLFLIISIMGPFWEELLFRGVILQSLLARWTKWSAVAVSSLLFALIHFHPVHGSIALVIGVVVGTVTVATGSIWAAIIVHVVNNAAADLGMTVLPLMDYLPLWISAPGVLLTAGGLYLVLHGTEAARPPVSSQVLDPES